MQASGWYGPASFELSSAGPRDCGYSGFRPLDLRGQSYPLSAACLATPRRRPSADEAGSRAGAGLALRRLAPTEGERGSLIGASWALPSLRPSSAKSPQLCTKSCPSEVALPTLPALSASSSPVRLRDHGGLPLKRRLSALAAVLRSVPFGQESTARSPKAQLARPRNVP